MSHYTEQRNKIKKKVEGISLGRGNFNDVAVEIFYFQYRYNPFYRSFVDLLNVQLDEVISIEHIPFLPIQFFKKEAIKTGEWEEEKVFQSSGTTGSIRSKHFIRDLDYYLENSKTAFRAFYDAPENYCFLAYLPGYEERQDSSLIYMVNELIKSSKNEQSGFYLGREKSLEAVLQHNKQRNIPTILFGVSFALLSLSKLLIDFPDLIVIETGGMKNSNIELRKEEIVKRLSERWNLKSVHSEYGMTELLSQSYSKDGIWFSAARTKRVLIGMLRDPFAYEKPMKTGVIKIVDLANFDTCSFIETQDLGLMKQQGQFQILGRMDAAELRGCNLLLDETLKNPVG